VKATVLVRPKPGILDPQGQAVEASLRQLGFDVSETRIGRLVDVQLETEDPAEAQQQLEQMCAQLLTNPLIERYEVHLDGSMQ
jgi:phosphoribosylformylglycinamidine synthase